MENLVQRAGCIYSAVWRRRGLFIRLVSSRGPKVGTPRLVKPRRNATQDIYQRMNRRCFVGLTITSQLEH